LFRVLSEEESKKVTRWQAPELGSASTVVAKTLQQANPQKTGEATNIQAILGSLDLKPGIHRTQSTTPQLQSIASGDVFANNALLRGHGAGSPSSKETGIQVSAELLQTSYDEGYSRGFAEGNAALHQHSIKELRTVIEALSTASRRSDDSGLEQELVALSIDIARMVIQREISLAPDIMSDIVSAGIAHLEGVTALAQVHLHPLDANIVREHQADDVEVRVLDDPSLDRGACRIESGCSVVNAGIEDWLKIAAVQLGVATDPLTASLMDLDSASLDDADVS